MSTSSRRDPTQRHNPAFVPSPRWLSESPARPSSTANGSHGAVSLVSAPSYRRNPPPPLMSPVPPPPANLHSGKNASAFNVDPGVPFLATAGPSDGGDTERDYMEDDEEDASGRRRFVGGFVTGIKRAMRRSLREGTRSRRSEDEVYQTESDGIRDSGYASSPGTIPAPPPIRPPYVPDEVSTPSSSHRKHATSPRSSGNMARGHEATYTRSENASLPNGQEVMSPQSFGSAISADPEYGSDYANMALPPPKSDISLNSYIRRFQNLVHEISSLPWVAKGRVTADYYPELTRREDPEHLPAMEWHSHACNVIRIAPQDYPFFGAPPMSETSSSIISSSDSGIKAPHHVSSGVLDLDAEFHEYPRAQQYPNSTPGSNLRYGLSPGPPGLPPNTAARPFTEPMMDQPPNSAPWQNGGNLDYAGAWEGGPPRDSNWQPNARASHAFDVPPAPAMSDRNSATGDWEDYPRYMNGYVAPQYAENHYGSEYGPGIHSARPGFPPVASGPPSPTSTPHRHPVYMTPKTPRS